MSDVQNIAAVKEELLKRKQELEEELSELSQDKFSDDTIQDPADAALSSTMDSLTNSFQQTKLAEYNRVVQALQMIEEGGYGICVDCERPISDKRLKSFPNATRCLACQEEFETTGGIEDFE